MALYFPPKISVSAGAASTIAGSFVFSNSNGVSFGLNGSTITGSVAGGGAPNFSAGTTSSALGSVVFSNSNGVSFGLNGSTITASAAGAPNFSAGTTSSGLNSVVFSNSNGLAFGLNGSTITGSYTVPSTAGLLSAFNVSAGTTSQNLSNFVLSNSNGLAFGLNGSTVTGSYTVPSLAGLISAVNISAGTTSTNLTNFVFSNSNGVSFGINGSTITASAAGGGGNVNFSAGTTSSGLNSVVFSNSNGVSFGLNGSTITGSVAVAGGNNLNWFALGNTTQNSSSVISTGSISLNGIGALTVGYSNNSIQLSAPQTSSMVGTGQVSIVTNVSTISIGVPAALTRLFFNPYEEAPMTTAKLSANGAFHISPVPEMPTIGFDRVVFGLFGSNALAAASAQSYSITFIAGLYSRNASTLSLVASVTNSTAVSISTNNTTLFSGFKNWSMGWTTTLSAGDYWMGFGSSTNTGGTNSFTIANQVVSGPTGTGFNGQFGVAANATNQDILGLGFYSAATVGVPSSIAFSQINGTNGAAYSIPLYGFLSQTA